MTEAEFEALVSEAMLAPSAHNTQPARWSRDGDTILVSADLSRRLPVGDPDDRDLHISCGAAVEGTVLALATRAMGASVTWSTEPDSGKMRPIARVTPEERPDPDDVRLASFVSVRTTHRTGFMPVSADALAGWEAPCLTLIREANDLAWLGRQIDIASAAIMRDKAFRKELLTWMRLKRSEPRYHSDGLNADVLAMDRVTAALVRPILGSYLYDLLAVLGFGPALSGEAKVSQSGGAIALFHWPEGQSHLEAGRAFYRLWLDATSRGLAGWPAAALADHPETRISVSSQTGIPPGRVLLNALRIGVPKGRTPDRSRLSVKDVIEHRL